MRSRAGRWPATLLSLAMESPLVSPSKEDGVYNRFLASVDERLRQLDEERIKQGLRPSLLEVCGGPAHSKPSVEGKVKNQYRATHSIS